MAPDKKDRNDAPPSPHSGEPAEVVAFLLEQLDHEQKRVASLERQVQEQQGIIEMLQREREVLRAELRQREREARFFGASPSGYDNNHQQASNHIPVVGGSFGGGLAQVGQFPVQGQGYGYNSQGLPQVPPHLILRSSSGLPPFPAQAPARDEPVEDEADHEVKPKMEDEDDHDEVKFEMEDEQDRV